MNSLNQPKYSVICTLIISIICFTILQLSGALDNVGMAAIILNWVPFIIGIVTIILFFIVRLIVPKFAWIVTILGAIWNIGTLISAVISV